MILPLIIFLVVILMYFKLLRDLRKNKIGFKNFLFWILIWFALSLVAFFPGIVISLANFIGVERAKDLPIYASIIILFVLLFKVGIKMEKVEQEITKLVKNIALKDLINKNEN